MSNVNDGMSATTGVPATATTDDHPRRCTAHRRDGTRCRRWAIRGGVVCPAHGGSAPHVRRAGRRRAERDKAVQAVATLGLRRDVSPHEALLEEVHRTAGHVAWLGQVVGELDKGDVERGSGWVDVYRDEREHLRRVCDSAVRSGVEEHQVRLQEQMAQEVATRIRRVLVDVGVDPDDEHVRAIVRARLVEGVG